MKELEPATRLLLDRGAAELWRDGALVGHVTTALERGWGSGRPLSAQTFVWWLVTLLDGTCYVIEDYPPYATLPGALAGSLDAEAPDEPPYEVRWLEGADRDRVWAEVGIHRSFGSYRFEGTRRAEWWWSRLLDRLRDRKA